MKIFGNFFWKKCQVFGNFLTVEWQFSGGSGSGVHRSSYDVGDHVTLRVDMRNGRDERVVAGGDEVRVWLKHDTQLIAANVLDLNNGSHLATALLPWRGVYE